MLHFEHKIWLLGLIIFAQDASVDKYTVILLRLDSAALISGPKASHYLNCKNLFAALLLFFLF